MGPGGAGSGVSACVCVGLRAESPPRPHPTGGEAVFYGAVGRLKGGGARGGAGSGVSACVCVGRRGIKGRGRCACVRASWTEGVVKFTAEAQRLAESGLRSGRIRARDGTSGRLHRD